MPAGEQSRARRPDREGFVERDGIRIFCEEYGDGEPTIVLMPTWSIVHSRHWKAQIPYLARHARVLTFDGRGNGRADRPSGAAAYRDAEFAADTLAVMAETATEHATLVAVSRAAAWATIVAVERPEMVDGIVYIGSAAGLAPDHPEQIEARQASGEDLDAAGGWVRYHPRFWSRHHREFLEFFFAKCLTEPHSTKQIEDAVGWGLESTPDVLTDTTLARSLDLAGGPVAHYDRVRCPTLVIHGDADAVRPHAEGEALAAATGGALVTFRGGGHLVHARNPIAVNRLVREFACPAPAPRPSRRIRARRALFVSSPIGLGHARRDVAIARQLRRLHPDLEIDWLAQHPVTTVLAAAGERIHPASADLASESAHIEAESGEYELPVFDAIRRMDEILVANFMVFHDVVRDEPYDLWIGDEAWEVDYFLHENPDLKTAAYAWMTDFVGWLPMPEAGEREAFLTADLNAEMIEHVARLPWIRDRSIFIGDPDDVVPGRFGSGLPDIPEWTERHFDFAGYITGFEGAPLADRARLRAELGYGAHERVCIATVGGSGVGRGLLQRVVDAFPVARTLVPDLRMIIVCGPRVDPGALRVEGLEVRTYVNDLYRHLAACDLAIVHGGLATTMELTANGRPFLYFPLRAHFEQTFHVAHRLHRHRAGRRMDFDATGPDELAAAIAAEIGAEVDYRAVDDDGAVRAAARIAELL